MIGQDGGEGEVKSETAVGMNWTLGETTFGTESSIFVLTNPMGEAAYLPLTTPSFCFCSGAQLGQH